MDIIKTEEFGSLVKNSPEFKNIVTEVLADTKPTKPEMGQITKGTGSGLAFTSQIAGIAKSVVGVYNPTQVPFATKKKMRLDPQIAFGLEALKAPLMSMDKWIECDDREIKEAVEAALFPHWKSLMRTSLNAIDFGCQPHEKVWKYGPLQLKYRDENGKVVKEWKDLFYWEDFLDLDPEQVTIYQYEDRSFAGIKLAGNEKEIVKAEKTFLMILNKEFGNLWGRSRLDPAYSPWYFSTIIEMFCNHYFERKGDPSILGRAPAISRPDENGQNVNCIDYMLSIASGLRGGGMAIVPSEFDEKGNKMWDLSYLLDDKRADQFMEYMEYLQILKLRGLCIPDRVLTQSDKYGTHAVVKIHTDTFMGLLVTIQGDVVDYINKYIIDQFVLYNFGEKADKAYLKTSGMSKANEELLKELLIELLAAEDKGVEGDKTNNIRNIVNIKKLLDQLNVPQTDDLVEENEMSKEEGHRETIELASGSLSIDSIDNMAKEWINENEDQLNVQKRKMNSELSKWENKFRQLGEESVKGFKKNGDSISKQGNDAQLAAFRKSLAKLNVEMKDYFRGNKSENYLAIPENLAKKQFKAYMSKLKKSGVKLSLNEETLQARHGGVLDSLIRNIDMLAEEATHTLEQLVEGAVNMGSKTIETLKRIAEAILFRTRRQELTVEAPYRGEFRRSWLWLALLVGFIYYKRYSSGRQETRSDVDEEYSDRIGELDYWNSVGYKLNSPEPLERYGLHYGDTGYWFPVPTKTIIDGELKIYK